MQYKDGTGPLNRGQKTGRQMGNCVSENNREMRLGGKEKRRFQGRCPNNRRQRRCMGDLPNPGSIAEKENLEREVANLESQLNDLKLRLIRFE